MLYTDKSILLCLMVVVHYLYSSNFADACVANCCVCGHVPGMPSLSLILMNLVGVLRFLQEHSCHLQLACLLTILVSLHVPVIIILEIALVLS